MARGFTLIELLAVLAAAGVLAVLSWPPLQESLTRARRADATAALLQLEAAQARYRAAHGLYAADARALGAAGAAHSPQGLYQIAFETGPGESYRAVARANVDGPQARDRDCAVISLHVQQGFAQRGPSPACWVR